MTDRAHRGNRSSAMKVGGFRSPAIWAALTDPDLDLVNLAHADSYPQRYAYLT